MPRLTALVLDQVTLKIPAGAADVLTVVYRPRLITPEFQEAWVLAQRTNVVSGAIYGPLSELIVKWDLLDDEDQPYGTDAEALKRVPTVALLLVMKAILSDIDPKMIERRKNGATSGGISPRTEA